MGWQRRSGTRSRCYPREGRAGGTAGARYRSVPASSPVVGRKLRPGSPRRTGRTGAARRALRPPSRAWPRHPVRADSGLEVDGTGTGTARDADGRVPRAGGSVRSATGPGVRFLLPLDRPSGRVLHSPQRERCRSSGRRTGGRSRPWCIPAYSGEADLLQIIEVLQPAAPTLDNYGTHKQADAAAPSASRLLQRAGIGASSSAK